MTRKDYMDRVVARLRGLTWSERDAIRTEIDAHIEDHICGLMELGYSEELAEERTMLRMGDPEEVGRELDKQYPLRWLVIGRIASVALVLLVLVCLLGIGALNSVFNSLRTRIVPWSDIHESVEERVNLKMDLQMEVGSDIVRVLGSGTEVTDDGAEVVIVYCQYDKNPFGYVSHANLMYEDCRGEETRSGSGGGHSTAGASYWRREILVQYGDPYVTMYCERFGTRQELQIPLKWEGEA